MVYVKKLDWEEWNVEHIKKHSVVVEEVEQVCHGKHVTRLGKKGRLLNHWTSTVWSDASSHS